MRLVIDCRFSGKSGIGTYLDGIVEELVNHHPEHQYLLVCYNNHKKWPTKENLDYLVTDIKPFSLKELFRFPVTEINKCDAYFSPYINIPFGIHVPIYSTIHDVIFLDMPKLTNSFGRTIRFYFLKRAYHMSQAVFTVSNFSKERIQHHLGKERKITIVYNGLSEGIRHFDTNNINKGNYFLFVGNIKKHKGLHILLCAFAKAKQKGLKGKLVLVGQAEKFRTSDAELSEAIQNIEDVEFTGYVKNEQLCHLMAGAKALVLPSLYEGFGIPPMEALYLGTKPIVSDLPVLKEIYGKLPVNFFKTGNSDDLAYQMLKVDPSYNIACTRAYIDEHYNFKIMAQKILKEITETTCDETN